MAFGRVSRGLGWVGGLVTAASLYGQPAKAVCPWSGGRVGGLVTAVALYG